MLKRLIEQAVEKNLAIELLERGQFQPRQLFDPAKLQELADSIKVTGIFTRLIVRPKSANRYEIIAGERRWRAAQLAGLQEVPCKIVLCNDEQALQVALIENIAREELNVIEEAQGIQRLIAEFSYTHEDVAEQLGKSRPKITNLLRLLSLHKEVQQLILEGHISESHGKLLAVLPKNEQFQLAREAYIKQWSTRSLDNYIKNLHIEKKRSTTKKMDSNIKRLERVLSDHMGYAVKIHQEGKGGHVKIEYHSIEEFEGICQRLGYQDDN